MYNHIDQLLCKFTQALRHIATRLQNAQCWCEYVGMREQVLKEAHPGLPEVMSVSHSACREITEVAGELERMSNQSNGRTQAPSALQMSMQLGDMLEQKAYQGSAAAEAHRHDHTRMLLQKERLEVNNMTAEVCRILLRQSHLSNKHDVLEVLAILGLVLCLHSNAWRSSMMFMLTNSSVLPGPMSCHFPATKRPGRTHVQRST